MAQQAITLIIAGKSYSLNIESGKEEVYRAASDKVNEYLVELKKNNFKNWVDKDYIAVAALKFAIATIDMRRSREVGGEDLERLALLDGEIDSYLNNLK